MNNNTHGPKNWAHLHADSLRRIVARHDPEIDNAEMERRAAIYELLGEMLEIEPDAPRRIMDSGALNDEVKAYCAIACKAAKVSEDVTETILRKISAAFDDYTAAEAIRQAEKMRH